MVIPELRKLSVISRIMPLSKPPREMLLRSKTSLPLGRLSPFGQSRSKAVSTDKLPKVFTDDENGIVCYRTQTGEMICEGRDEGPYYDPPQPRACPLIYEPTSVTKSSLLKEVMFDLKAIEYMGSFYCEGRDEG